MSVSGLDAPLYGFPLKMRNVDRMITMADEDAWMVWYIRRYHKRANRRFEFTGPDSTKGRYSVNLIPEP